MERSSPQEDERQELWHTLEVLMHGKAAPEVRCAQQRLEKMQTRLRPYLAPTTRSILTKVIRAAVCASQGGEQRFHWLAEVERHWRALTMALESQRRGHSPEGSLTSRGSAGLAHF